MWRLKNTANEFGLFCDRNLVVGRKDADIVVSGDSSVSRKHATIKITHAFDKLKIINLVPSIEVEDSSKFGTYVTHNGQKQKVGGKVKLYHGDTVQFGAQHSIYSLTYSPFVVTTSMLDNALKGRLQESILALGGHMVNSWNDKVTHIIVTEIKLSVKVTQALVNGCHIVTPQYVFELEKQGQANLDTDLFLPVLAEPNLSVENTSFKVKPERKSVFHNHIFVYFCKQQMKRLGSTIISGGGRTMMVDDPEVNKKFLTQPNVSVILPTLSEGQNKAYDRIEKLLLENDRRFIQEHEIGLAVLYCDSSVYCNPDFDLNSQNTFTQQKSNKDTIKVESVDMTPHDLQSTSTTMTRKRQRGMGSSTDDGEQPTKQDSRSRLSKKQKRGKDFPEVDGNNKPTESSSKVIELNSLASDPGRRSEEVPDSCLDDDSLWSQNLDSQLHKSRRVMETDPPVNVIPPSCPSPENVYSNLPRGKSIKIEQKTPCKQPIFPSEERSSLVERNSGPVITNTGIKVESQPVSFETEFSDYVPMVDVVSLIFARKHSSIETTQNCINAKINFKRFKKVWPTYMELMGIQSDSMSSHPIIPRIIGGSDLYEHQNDTQKTSDIFDWVKGDVKTSENLDESQDATNPFFGI